MSTVDVTSETAVQAPDAGTVDLVEEVKHVVPR
jgi:hypothetical protein